MFALLSTQIGFILISTRSSGGIQSLVAWLWPGCSGKLQERGGLRGLLQYADMAESESGATGENALDQVAYSCLFSTNRKWHRG